MIIGRPSDKPSDKLSDESRDFKHLASLGRLFVPENFFPGFARVRVGCRQIYQKSGYGKEHKQWPVWVDAVTGSVLAVGGGTVLGLGLTQNNENDVEYRTNPETGVRERKEVPNSSDQDAYLAAGGASLGVSVPFLISAIHNGVKTKDRNIGKPVRTNITTRIRYRTTTIALANVPVVVTLPDGTKLNATADGNGKVKINLPDIESKFFPLKMVAFVTIPSKEVSCEIPANADTLSLLPPSVRIRADALADSVRNAKQELVRAQMTILEKVTPLYQTYLALKPQYVICTVWGEIRNWDSETLSLWGGANCDATHTEGRALKNTNLLIQNYSRQRAEATSYSTYTGQHYFLYKTSGIGTFGQLVPVRVYGSKPTEKGKVKAAHNNWNRAKAKYNPLVEKAEARLIEAVAQYNQALPTNPYGL